MSVKGVIFDFNGTMLFDSDKHEKAWRIFIGELCGRDISDEEFRQYVHGRTNTVVLKYFLKEDISRNEIIELSRKKETIYRELCLNDLPNFKLVEGLVPFLEYLRKNEIPRTIATSSGKENLDFYTGCFNLERWFDLNKIVYDDGSFLGKPNPDIYLKAAEKIGVAPQNCMVIEDAISGIQSAYTAGVRKIIVITQLSDQHNYMNIDGVFAVVNNFEKLKHFLPIS